MPRPRAACPRPCHVAHLVQVRALDRAMKQGAAQASAQVTQVMDKIRKRIEEDQRDKEAAQALALTEADRRKGRKNRQRRLASAVPTFASTLGALLLIQLALVGGGDDDVGGSTPASLQLGVFRLASSLVWFSLLTIVSWKVAPPRFLICPPPSRAQVCRSPPRTDVLLVRVLAGIRRLLHRGAHRSATAPLPVRPAAPAAPAAPANVKRCCQGAPAIRRHPRPLPCPSLHMHARTGPPRRYALLPLPLIATALEVLLLVSSDDSAAVLRTATLAPQVPCTPSVPYLTCICPAPHLPCSTSALLHI